MTGRNLRLRADAVDRPQYLDLHAESGRDLSQRLAIAHPVGLPRHQRLVRQLQLCREHFRPVDRQKNRVFVGAGDDRPIVLRIEVLKLVHRHLGQLGGFFQIDLARHPDDGEIRRVRDVGKIEPVLFGVADDVLERLQLRQVIARLVRHLEIGVAGREACFLVLRDRAGDVAFTPVVAGERELPVAEIAVELLEVRERAFGRGDDVAARVEPEILLQPVVRARRRHELPDSGRPGHRHRVGIERALDHRQEGDLQRHAAFLDLDDDVIQVSPAAIDHARDVVRARRIPLFPFGDEGIVDIRHREAATDARPEILGGRWQRLEPGRRGDGRCGGGDGGGRGDGRFGRRRRHRHHGKRCLRGRGRRRTRGKQHRGRNGEKQGKA